MIRVDVNAPAVYEGYHAHWHCLGNGSEEAGEWRAEIPLTVHGQPTGRLEAVGRRGLEPVAVQMATLMEFAESLEATVAKLGKSANQAAPVANGPAASSTNGQSVTSSWKVPNASLATNGQAGETSVSARA